MAIRGIERRHHGTDGGTEGGMVIKDVDARKGKQPTGDRVEDMPRRAVREEQLKRLEAEAAAFFAEEKAERDEVKDLQKAGLRVFGKD